MLQQIDWIKKIGLFSDYSPATPLGLEAMTVIYGDNGTGKSTLAAILDSLRECCATEILRRKSLPGNIAPTTKVTFAGKEATFDGDKWDSQPLHDSLDVFFPGFVNRNVHAATCIDTDQKRHLCELVLGREAVANIARLAQADSDSRQALTEKKRVESEIGMVIKPPATLESFIALTNCPDIDQQIERTRTELRQAQSMQAIIARPLPSAEELPVVDLPAISALVGKAASGIGTDAAAIVQKHIAEHLDTNGENWLRNGARYLKQDECPFCAQKTSGSSLAEAIKSYFSDEYKTFWESLSTGIAEARRHLGRTRFAELKSSLARQVAVAAQWTDESPIDQARIDSLLSEAETAWLEGAQQFEALLAEKLAQPLDKMIISPDAEWINCYEQSFRALGEINQTILASRAKAEQRRAALSGANVTEIASRLATLENHKKRWEPAINDLITKRSALDERRTVLDAEKTQLRKKIDEHADRVVGKYQDGINHYLQHFGCNIRIESVESKYPGGKASVQYKLKVHGHEISLGASDAAPCFETVLSEGDKYTLALSFFFARLKPVEDLSGRVIVLDDPVNSLGNSRRYIIVGIIRDLRRRGAQVVILTHDEQLAALIWHDRDPKIGPSVFLQVERCEAGSHLALWDIEKATQTRYVQDFLAIADFLEKGGDHNAVAGRIRPYVEQRLRHVFPGPPFVPRDALGPMIGKIRKCDQNSRIACLKEKLPDLETINDSALPSHHATDDTPRTPLTADEVRLFANKALGII